MSLRKFLLVLILILSVNKVQAAPVFIGSRVITFDSSTTATSKSVLITTGANFILVATSSYTGGTALTVTDNLLNTYLPLTSYKTPADSAVQLFYALNPSVSATTSFTISGTTVFPAGVAIAFSGISSLYDDLGDNLDGSFVSVKSASRATNSNYTNTLLLSLLSFNASGVASGMTGWTIVTQVDAVGGSNYGAALAYKIRTTTGQDFPSWTAGNTTVMNIGEALFLASDSVLGVLACGNALLIGVGC